MNREKHDPEFLNQVIHLLDNLKTNNLERNQHIESLQRRVKGLIHLSLQGYKITAGIGIDVLVPEIEELVKSYKK